MVYVMGPNQPVVTFHGSWVLQGSLQALEESPTPLARLVADTAIAAADVKDSKEEEEEEEEDEKE